MIESDWMICPVCGRKTLNKIREDTVLKNYPLYCPKCKQETLISIKDLQITIIRKQEHESNYVSRRLWETP